MQNELYTIPLRMPGYLVAVSAPNSGIAAMKDGSWHVIAEVDSLGQGKARSTAQAMIPFVLGTGGDLVMYRMDEDNTVVLRQGGKVGAAPAVEDLVAYDPGLALELEESRKRYVMSSEARPKPVRASWKPDAWMGLAACVVLSLTMLGAGYMQYGGTREGRTADGVRADGSRAYGLDPNDIRMEAIRRGAYQVSMTDPENEKKTIVLRMYPKDDGTFSRQIVDRYWTSAYSGANGPPPEPPIPWTRR